MTYAKRDSNVPQTTWNISLFQAMLANFVDKDCSP
jgi:hypothetical protein